MASPSTRSIANVDLAVGLVTCPVKMLGVIEKHDRKGSMYHAHDDGSYGKVGMPKVCQGCQETLSTHDVSKGFDEGGETVVLTASELETIAANTGSSLEVPHFVRADQIDPMLYADQAVYRLIPDPKRGKQAAVTYQMIRAVLSEQGIVGVVNYVRWGRNHLALLDVEQTTGSLIVRNVMWPDELREASEVPDSDTDVDPRLMPVMQSLAESMTKTWNPSEYTDAYLNNLNEAISVKATGGEIASIAHGGDNAITDVSDLLAKLEASIEAKAPKAPAKRAAKKIA